MKKIPKQIPWKPLLLLLVVAGLTVTFAVADVKPHLQAFLEWIGELGAIGVVLFIAIYILATVLFVPGLILTLGAGFLFNVALGTVYVSIASVTGASLAFLVGRYLARDAIARKVEGNEKFRAIDEAVGKEGWKIVALTRLSPIFPFNLLNYAYGLTRVRFWHYFLASWICMLPGTVMYVYLGDALRQAGESIGALGSGERETTVGERVIFWAGLAIALIVTVYVTRVARNALEKKIA